MGREAVLDGLQPALGIVEISCKAPAAPRFLTGFFVVFAGMPELTRAPALVLIAREGNASAHDFVQGRHCTH